MNKIQHICIKCGSDKLYYAKGLCRRCYNLNIYYDKKDLPEYKRIKREYSHRSYEKDKDRILAIQKEKRNENPELYRQRIRLSMQKKRQILKQQGIDINEDYLFDNNKKIVLERDNYTCQSCGMVTSDSIKKYGVRLSVHHIDGLGESVKKKSEKNNSVDNLVTLCISCHNIEHQRIKHGKTPRTLLDFQR